MASFVSAISESEFLPGKTPHERGHGLGVKALPGEILNDAQSLNRIMRLLIRAVRGYGVKGVGDRDHARQ